MAATKTPQGILSLQRDFPLILDDTVIETLKSIPRVAKLNPRYLLLAYLMQEGAIEDRKLVSDFLSDDKIYHDKTLKEWLSRIMLPEDLSNPYYMKIELLSYVTKLGRRFGTLSGTVEIEVDEEYEEEEYVEEEYEDYADFDEDDD
jgi:hypothetical protein